MFNVLLKIILLFILGFIFIVGGYLTASKQIFTSELITISLLITISFPAIVGLIQKSDIKRAGIALILLALFAYIIESIGIITGFPYGSFTYKGTLGPQILGIVPVLLPFVWIPFVLSSFTIAKELKQRKWILIVTGTFVLLGMDFIIDPAAVALNYWSYNNGGFYYGIPLSNFAGWVLSGTIAMIICNHFFPSTTERFPSYIHLTTLIHFFFFIGVVFYFQLWIPFIIGIIYLTILTFLYASR